MQLIKKEIDLLDMYLCIYDRIRQKTEGNEITNQELYKMLGMIYKVKKISDKQIILKEMEMMGLLKQLNQQFWQINLKIKSVDMIKNFLYKKLIR